MTTAPKISLMLAATGPRFLALMTVVAILLCTQSVSAQTTGKIQGVVTDAQTGESLPGVNVIIAGTQQGSSTDMNGQYFLLNVEPGTYDVQASFIGYATTRQTGVVVTLDHTTELNFALQSEAIGLEEVVVEAEVEIVKMDMSSSSISIEAEDIESVPAVKDFDQFLNLQGGIEGMSVRGGGLGEIDFMLDGLSVVDNRSNTPMTNMVNLSAIKSAEIVKGGFNAEYGNVRSGVISVVTKDGDPDRYSGSIDFRAAPPQIKHSGLPLYDPMSYHLRPYFDEAVMWTGTANGAWSEEMQQTYPEFIGWNAVSEALLSDDNPDNDMTPEQARDKFLWETAAQGSSALGQRENIYGNVWDWRVDGSLGGPVPFVSKALGDMTFFVTHKTNREAFALPTMRPYFSEQNTMLKLTSRITPSLKVSAEGTYGKIESVVSHPREIQNINDYNKSAMDILSSPYPTAGSDVGVYSLYNPGGMNWADIYMSMVGINIDHMLSDRTFYKIRLSRSSVSNDIGRHQGYRDLTPVKQFGDVWVDERPWGLDISAPYSNQAGFDLAGTHGDPIDSSSAATYNVKFDLTSQVNNYNMIKTGFEFNYDNLHTFHKTVREYTNAVNLEEWEAPPIRIGAYLQNKFEWRGMIANVGVRADYYSPNTDWYFSGDPYDYAYSAEWASRITERIERSPTESHLKFSPRLGISHPITDVSKLYFNYGHFYSVSSAADRFRFAVPTAQSRLTFLGNPNLNLPRTIAYELGYEHQVGPVLVHLSGYYKDVANQTGAVSYTNFDASVDYTTLENNHYADIRGFEFRLEKNFGDWFRGWVNYNYMVQTNGFIGREQYFEDQRQQRIEGLQNPYQEKPLARPYARALMSFFTPEDFGPSYANLSPLGGWTLSFIYQFKAGRYQTWDPLDTDELVSNVQWKNFHNWDLRIGKDLVSSGVDIQFYADVTNLFNYQRLTNQAWSSGSDQEEYMRSLHLPMYAGEEYKAEGLVAGNDRPGDVRSADKPYINMPDRDFLWFFDQRTVEFGAAIRF